MNQLACQSCMRDRGYSLQIRPELTMTKRMKTADLREFDAAQHFDGEAVVAAYLTDILEANGPG